MRRSKSLIAVLATFAAIAVAPSAANANGAERRSTCATPSDLPGYTCMQVVGSSYSVHWARPDAGTVKLAARAQGEGWVALGFGTSMVNSEAVQGSQDLGTRTMMINGRSARLFDTAHSISGVDDDEVTFSLANGEGLLEFARTINGDFDVESPTSFVGAHQPTNADWNAYHGFRTRYAFQIDLSEAAVGDELAIPDTPAPTTPTPTSTISTTTPHPDTAASTMPSEDDMASHQSSCATPSDLPGYTCMQVVGSSYSVHWARPNAGTVKLAARVQGEGWVALGFGTSMVNSETVQGSQDLGTRTMMINGRSARLFDTAHSISGVDDDEVTFSLANGEGLLEFTRTINGDFDVESPTSFVGAHQPTNADWNAYHGFRTRYAFQIDLSEAAVGGTDSKSADSDGRRLLMSTDEQPADSPDLISRKLGRFFVQN